MAQRSENFVHLHVHSDMSQLDGCGRIEEYVETAAKRKNPAIAFTEHGTLRGFHSLHVACKDSGVKPIYGIEFYMSPDMRFRGLGDEEKKRVTEGLRTREERAKAIRAREVEVEKHGRWHLCAWAKTDEGLRNLFRLSSLAWDEGFYYKPRIDLDALLAHSNGLAVGTACISGPIWTLAREGETKRAVGIADALFDRFGEDFCIEIMPHDIDLQTDANRAALTMWKRYGYKPTLIATQDAHYVLPEDSEHHEVLLAIGTRTKMSDPDRFRFSSDGYHFRTREEMLAAFERYHSGIEARTVEEALDNTLDVAGRMRARVYADRLKCLLPPVEVPSEFSGDTFAYLRRLCLQGWEKRDIQGRSRRLALDRCSPLKAARQEYKDRLLYELRIIEDAGFTNYFLIVHDLYRWAREQKIACGPGRGSAAGSLVSYLLGITAIDPIKHDLIFERFISPDRHEMPDIDCDFEDVRRQEIMGYLRSRYGDDKVAQISTAGKMTSKLVVKDVASVFGVSFHEAKLVTSNMPDGVPLEEAFGQSKICKAFVKRHPRVLHHAKRLQGLTKSFGVHPAGIVTSPVPLVEVLPLETRDHSSGKPIKVTAVDMHGVEDLGLLKLDILGVRTISVINDAVSAIERRHGERVDLEALDLEDPDTLRGFSESDFAGVFQYDTASAERIVSGVEFESFSDIVVMTALNRPGVARSGLADLYLERRVDPAAASKAMFHPKVAAVTKETLGVFVYQEDVMRVLVKVAGFDAAEVDTVRRYIAKKEPEKLADVREAFLDGVRKTTPDMEESTAFELIDAIEEFSGYAFNKAHSTAYSMIAYWCMWLKRKYPLEFYWALLYHERRHEKIQQNVAAAQKARLEVLPADVSTSKVGFSIDESRGAIRGSLDDIKGVGEKAAGEIIEGQPYVSLLDFIDRVSRRRVTKTAFGGLLRAGALDEIWPKTKWLVENLEKFWRKVRSTAKPDRRRKGIEDLLRSADGFPDYTADERYLIASEVNPFVLGANPLELYKPFIDAQIKVELHDIGEDDIFDFDGRGVWIAATVVKVHEGHFRAKTEEDGDAFGHTRRFVNLYLEGPAARRRRVQLDWHIVDDLQPVVSSGVGTPVLALVKPSREYDSFRAAIVLDVRRLKIALESRKDLSVWELIATGHHPALEYPWKKKASRREAMLTLDRFRDLRTTTIFKATGVVVGVKRKIDRNGDEMAFFGLVGVNGYLDCICFGRAWPDFKTAIKNGQLLTVRLQKTGRDTFSLDENSGKVWKLKGAS